MARGAGDFVAAPAPRWGSHSLHYALVLAQFDVLDYRDTSDGKLMRDLSIAPASGG